MNKNIMKSLEKEWSGPLFKYAVGMDIIRDFNIRENIWVRVTKSLIEVVVLENTSEFEVRVIAFMLNHVVGKFLVNTPLPEDSDKLKHILDVKNETKDNQVSSAMFRELEKFPTHFVLYSDFNIGGSGIIPLIASDKTAGRLLNAFQA